MVGMRDIVSTLSELTNLSRVPWKAMEDNSTFIAEYGDLAVVLALYGTEPRETILLTVHDDQGEVIDNARHEGPSGLLRLPEQEKYPELRELYDSAKRVALGVDDQLSILLDRMNAAPPPSPG